MPELNYETLNEMKKNNASWRLLTADNSPLIISFLNRAFIIPNHRTRSESDLTELLDDELYFLRERYGYDVFRRSSADYLKEWTEHDRRWLRRFYPNGSDEPHYDVTPAAEKVVSWLGSLFGNSFVGTESRLKTIFDLLRQMVEGSEVDPKLRIEELKKRRDEIDREISRIEGGEITLLDDTSLKDRFQQFSSTAMELLSDLRTVEYNFRELNNAARERIARWNEGKGALLDEILGDHDAISDSDQGRSFRAFTAFLLSNDLRQEFEELMEHVMNMSAVRDTSPDKRLRRINKFWLDAGIHVQEVAASLSEQLRRFLDNSVLLENRRIAEIFKKIQEHALDIRNDQPRGDFMEIDNTSLDISLIMERPLFSLAAHIRLESGELLPGDEDIDASALFEQIYVDIAQLKDNIERSLRHASQITLREILAEYPPQRGLAEILAYMNIAANRAESVFDESEKELLEWRNELGNRVEATAPRIIFTR
ncbi:MAG: DUF3375 domain-containing protein [Synergistaceae bacterium]|jgi:hypothetical protein|nr:DUF3375 domain-containing protein [Synergistaceae bacterium]